MKNRINYTSIILASMLMFSGCGGGGNDSGGDKASSTNENMIQNSPIVTLNGDKKIHLMIGESYEDEGATAFDKQDGDLTSAIKTTSTLDNSKPGRYEIIYEVTDREGHTTTLKRKVYIADFIASPVSRTGVSINEILTANANTKIDPDFRQFSDWIELYNNSNSDLDLGGYYLSDDKANPRKWRIPNSTTIKQHGYTLIWADKEDTKLHTNFSLSSSGGTLILSDSSGREVDQITYEKQKSDISCSKINDHIYFTEPTPQSANKNAYGELWKSKKPDFAQEGGFYSGTQNITLTQENGGNIYYTTDGSIPTTNSNLYTNPIKIDKTTIIRARAMEDNRFLSSTKSQTYLINENISLPVVSIGIDDKYLFDDKIGIYVEGLDSKYPNYAQDWMRPASVEYIKDKKVQFSENIGVKIFGNFTRTYAQKSLSIYAKDKYGAKSIDYPLFDYKPYIKKVKSFGLRVSGNDWGYTMMKDGLIQTIVKDTMDIDYQAYQPAIVFINGKYWGIQNIREKANENYIEANHGVDREKIDLIKTVGQDLEEGLMSGDTIAYKNLIDYVKGHDLSNNTFYTSVTDKVDTTEYINYMITEIFVGNSDWLGKNVRFWRERSEKGKWRWILHDTDFGFGLHGYDTSDLNNLANATKKTWRTTIFTGLLNNNQFKNEFISRFVTHLNTTFKPNRIENIINRFKKILDPEIDRHIQKWSENGQTRSSWESHLDRMINYVYERNDYVRGHIQKEFNLSGNINLNIFKSDNGTILVDDVPLESDFDGNYFANTNITLKATPKKGYKFVKWSDGSTSNPYSKTLSSNITLSAIFEEAPSPKIVINEFNYNSDKDFKTGDWIELYNNGAEDIDLSGWELKDSKQFSSFKIPNQTILGVGEYLVLTKSLAEFQAYYPNVNAIGNFDFGLGSENSIRLFDNIGTLIDIVNYDKNWPDAKGNGKTLTLNNPDSDNSQAQNWSASDQHGSPGEGN